MNILNYDSAMLTNNIQIGTHSTPIRRRYGSHGLSPCHASEAPAHPAPYRGHLRIITWRGLSLLLQGQVSLQDTKSTGPPKPGARCSLPRHEVRRCTKAPAPGYVQIHRGSKDDIQSALYSITYYFYYTIVVIHTLENNLSNFRRAKLVHPFWRVDFTLVLHQISMGSQHTDFPIQCHTISKYKHQRLSRSATTKY